MHTVQRRGLIFPVRVEGIGRHINLSEKQGAAVLLPGFSRHALECKLIRSDMQKTQRKRKYASYMCCLSAICVQLFWIYSLASQMGLLEIIYTHNICLYLKPHSKNQLI